MRPSPTNRDPRRAERSCVCAFALGLLWLAGAGVAEAQCILRAQAGSAFQEQTVGIAAANDSTLFGSTGTTASYGELSAFSVVGLSGSGSDGGSLPIPVAFYEDEWTVTIPSQPGLFSGTLTVAFILTGEPTIDLSPAGIGAIHNMNTSYQLNVTRNAGAIFGVSGGRIQTTGALPEMSILGDVPAPGRLLVDFPVVFGVPFTLGFELISTTGGNQFIPPGLTGNVRGESTMQLFWDGIVSLEDPSGNDLLAFADVTTCSGTDWRESQAPPPVPLGPFVALGVSAAAIALVARGRVETR
ncbi:MAG: hypothetical protein AAGC67_12395 [Myxococcota bacterium]